MKHLAEPSAKYEKKPPREDEVIACEICGALMKFQDALSLAVVYRMPGPQQADETTKLPSYQCKDWQHFGCCHEHALLALLHCIFEHIHFGEHSTSGSIIEHSKLQRIASVLEEAYESIQDGVSGDV